MLLFLNFTGSALKIFVNATMTFSFENITYKNSFFFSTWMLVFTTHIFLQETENDIIAHCLKVNDNTTLWNLQQELMMVHLTLEPGSHFNARAGRKTNEISLNTNQLKTWKYYNTRGIAGITFSRTFRLKLLESHVSLGLQCSVWTCPNCTSHWN